MRYFFISLTVIIHLSTVKSRVGRCCEKGEYLVESFPDLKCTPVPDKQLQQILSARRQGRPNGLPYCGKPSHHLLVLAEDAEEIAVKSCLDFFHDHKSNETFPVFAYCPPPLVQASTSSSKIPHFRFLSQAILKPAPRIAQLRKCCPVNMAYNRERKLCVQPEQDDRGMDFRVLFQRLPSLDFIDVEAYGAPNCHDAVLVDFSIEQLYLSSEAEATASQISISIAQNGSSKENVTINANTSCVDSYGDELIVRLCQELDYCEENACVRKCCSSDDDEQQKSLDKRCAEAPSTFQNFSSALLGSDIKFADYGLLTGIPCIDVFLPDDEDETWSLDDKGNVILRSISDPTFIDTYNYANVCLDFMKESASVSKVKFLPTMCLPFVDDPPLEKWQIGGALQIISCIFLAITFMVYCCLPALQNLHGKTLMCHVASLFVAYATLSTIDFTNDAWAIYLQDELLEDKVCKFLSYILLLGFHSAFFWLNVMCFDIWWTFRGIREAKRHRQTSRFLAYCAYAWGLALFFVILLFSLEFSGVLPVDIVGKERCWFGDRSIVHVVFFLLPVNLTLLVNLIFFLVTARRCSQVKAEINRAMANDKCVKNFRCDRSRLIMNVKLFIVMGIPWLFENLSALLENYDVLPLWLREVFYAVDVMNSLQGVWIFILFALKSKVYEALRKRLRPNVSQVAKSMSTSNNTQLSVNKPNARARSASNTTITSSFLST